MARVPNNERNESLVQSVSGGISLGAYNRIEKIGDMVAGNKTVNVVVYTGPSDRLDASAQFSLEQAYRSEVALRYAVWRERYAPLTMTTMASSEKETHATDVLEREDLVFTALATRFERQVESPGTTEESSSRMLETHTFTDLREGAQRYRDIALLGPPGAGKTTALWRLALDLAQDGLEGREAHAAPMPIFVRLGGIGALEQLLDLARRDLKSATVSDRKRRLIPLVAHRQLASLLPRLLEQGRVVLLWDGLNETPREQTSRVAQAIAGFGDTYPGTITAQNRSITTCRIEDYDALLADLPEGTSPTLQRVTIQNLDAAMTEAMVIARLGQEQGERLLSALDTRPNLSIRAVVRTPLLLTMLCEVYRRSGHMPSSRGKLLEAFIEARWSWERQRQPATQWISARLQKEALARLAYTMTKEHGRGTSVSWLWAGAFLRPAGNQFTPDELRRLAQDADILESVDGGTSIRFSHQLIQEYFAAVALEREFAPLEQPHLKATLAWQQQLSRWQHKISEYIAPGQRTGWEETVFLLAGLREHHAPVQELMLVLLSRPLELLPLLQDEAVDGALREAVREDALRRISDASLRRQERVDAGVVLAELGDPRPGVCDLRIDLCDVPKGPFLLGSTNTDRRAWGDEKPQRTVDLPGFRISRYPVTKTQWRMFIKAGGYAERRWWSDAGWQVKEDEGWTMPVAWDEPRFSGPNQPVVGVSWYEANAFCRWLSAELGYDVRLPSEAEWEKAARGEEGRIYPWGNEWDPERANTSESAVNKPLPVGCYPSGKSPYGVLDMSGSVWEWTATPWTRDYQESNGTTYETDAGAEFVRRGGSWADSHGFARCAYRDHSHPSDRLIDLGLRVVAALTLGRA